MKIRSKSIMPVFLAVVGLAFVVSQTNAFAGYGGHGKGGWHLKRMMAAVGLSDEQTAEVKNIISQSRTNLEPALKQLRTERRALRNLIQSEIFDEGAIRNQADKIAKVQSDLAVERAQVYQSVLKVLSPEQIQKLKEFQEKRAESR
jgi:periplasmic protein CpxP/Spy